MFLLRLDDACEYMDVEKWNKMESLLDKYSIKPIFGIIPCCKDESLVSEYKKNNLFWDDAKRLIAKGWTPALHGYEHVYNTKSAGINPYWKRSEFAGLSYEEQSKKITSGYKLLLQKGIDTKLFFAPSHTFDKNTLKAIYDNTPIRIISDTQAFDIYSKYGLYFIPLQSSAVRDVNFNVSTFCYHPNTMTEESFNTLESFLSRNKEKFVSFKDLEFKDRKRSLIEVVYKNMYFLSRKVRRVK